MDNNKTIKFNNTPNEHIQIGVISNDKTFKRNIWVSRAPAVVGIILAYGLGDDVKVLTIRRSKHMLDEPMKLGAPSGYLDWNETGYEGITREIFEETSMFLPHYDQFLVYNNDGQPHFVQTDPFKDKHQNISLYYVMVYDFSGHKEFFPTEIEKFTCRETGEVKWMDLAEIYTPKETWAFGHDKKVIKAYDHFKSTQK